jgi:parallel beta-helix repeat protein
LAQLEPSFPGSEGYFAQIQPAVGASGAGAVVAVTEGVFYENVVIDKSLVLNPMPGATPVIDGGASDNVVTVAANEVVVEGFELRNGYNGIAGETSGSVFARNLIHDNLNIPGSAGVGILLWGDNDENAIQGNVIFNNDRQGILLGFSDDSKISNNNLISHNRIYDNGLYRYAKGPDESEHGVQLWHADASIVENNEIFGHDDWYFGHGIYLKASDGNGVFDNDLHDNMKGVSVHHGAVDNYLAGNVIHDNAYGLAIFDAGSHHTLVNFNQFCRNGSRGIYRGDFDAPKDVDATYNWWGSASGPGPVGPGTGDKVSEGINFWPWDDVPPTDGPCHINSIHIHKYKDLNVNGVKDEGEVGLNGWWLTLYNAQGKELMRRKTQTVGYQDGWALFEGVDPGEYKVCETLAGGWANSDPAGTPPCKWITVTDHGRAPSSGPLFAFFDHPGDDAYRLKYLGIDTWGLDPEQATEEEVLSRLSEPWLYVVSQLREPIDFADLLEDPPYALDPRNLIEWDVAEGFDTDLYYMTVDNEHFQHPIKLGVKSWRGKAGYSTATGFVEYGGVPTLLFGNYMPGSLEVVKHADQHQDHLFKFTFDGGDLFTLKHGQAKTFADLLPGSYTVAEKAAFVPDDHQGVHEVICQVEGGEGFFPSRDTYSAVVPVGFGEDVTCTFFNYPPPTVWVDDDWAGSDPGASVDGHTFGYDAFASVEVALDKVAPQGTVWVYDGTYEESVVVDKEGLSLQAASGLPMIKGSAGSEVVTVNAEDVTIDGFKIGGGSVGILGEMAGATITNNVIHDNEVGIHVVGYASDPAQILIADNELKMSSDAHVRFANLSADADIAALLTGNQTEDAGFAAIVINKAYLAAYDITIGGDPAHPNSFDGTGSHGQIYLSGAGWEDDDAPILATYNDFGVTLLEEIEEDIRHAVDDPALGMVDYFGIEVMADPSSVPAEGVSTATVTGSLTGLLSPAGNQIDFTTTLGELSASAGMTDADGEASVTLSSTDVGVATVTASAGASAGNPKAATTEVTLTEPVLTHFAFDPIDVQAFGASFEITIRAMSNAAPFDFDGSATLSDTTGTITPETVTFADGVWTGEVTIGLTAVDVVITAEADGITGSSDPFRVLGVPPEAEAFTFEPVTEQVAGAPFSITIYAIGNDSDGNGVGDVVDFNGYADLSDTTGTVTPTMIGPFDHGVWTGEVTIASAANEVVVTATDREDGTVVGSTDPFGVVAAEAGANEHFIYLPLVVK